MKFLLLAHMINMNEQKIKANNMKELINSVLISDQTLNIITKKLYFNGFSYLSIGSKKRKIIFKPILISTFLSLILIRELVCLSINDPTLRLMLGDVSFNWRIKSMWNYFIILSVDIVLIPHLIHFLHFRRYGSPFMHKNQMIFETSNEIKGKIKVLFKIVNFSSYFITSFGVFLSTIVYSINSCPLIQIILFGIPSGIVYSLMCFYITQHLFHLILYFCVLSFKFYTQLKLENQLLKYLSANRLMRKTTHLLKCLERMNQIHRQIDENNRFWSKFLFSTCYSLCGISGVMIAQLLQNIELIAIALFIFTASAAITLIIFLFIFGIRVHNESNNSYPILIKCFDSLKNDLNFLNIKIKVK